MKNQYLFGFAQVHEEFRIPELISIAELHNIALQIPKDADVSRPFMVLELESEYDALALARRCILIKWVCDFYGRGRTYEEVYQETRANVSKWEKYIENTSFRFIVTAYNHKIPQSRQTTIVESFSFMDLKGKIEMKNPDITLMCFEEYVDKHGTTRERHEGDGKFKEVFFGRLIAEGSARQLVKIFDVKKRTYFGNTSMEAEISLLMANQTLAAPGKLLYDPFLGTGSLAYTTAHFGAWVYGSDIDGRQMRGKQDMVPGVLRSAEQYGVSYRILDLFTFDVTQNPWRCGGLFDAIITDPPYGVRAGAKRLGRKKPLKKPQTTNERSIAQRPDDQPYIPPTKPYELSELATDLILLARYMLKPHGRLVFFLPTVTDEYEEVDVQTMLCEGMEVIANSLQDFGSWGRRLITIRKTTSQEYSRPNFAHGGHEQIDNYSGSGHIPAHKDFREKYFKGFRKDDTAEDASS
ncbi:tRNA guanosine-2'-O-methyltransferase [Panus rudis PR-1116 ss-1]|nr:tRNA guanosine-2'-O-methyltransferase [Panus rudis PR-1116 ss-1]